MNECNYFSAIHIITEKIIIGNTQLAQGDPEDVPWKSSKCLNVKPTREPTRDPQETLRKTIQKLMVLWKNCFSEKIVLVLHICSRSLQEEQIFKSSKRGRPQDVYGTQFLDVHGTKWSDVLRMSVGYQSNMIFKFNSQTH